MIDKTCCHASYTWMQQYETQAQTLLLHTFCTFHCPKWEVSQRKSGSFWPSPEECWLSHGKLDHSNFPRGKLDHFKFPCMKSESLTFQEEISVTLSFPEETGVTLPSLRLVWEIWGTLTFQTHTQKNQSLSFRHSLRKFGCLHFYPQSGSLLAYPMKIGESWLSNGKFRSLWLSQKAAGSLQSFRKKLEWPCS